MKYNEFFFIAHRGLSSTSPENTNIAFNSAWDKDCDGIELDIQLTKDKKVISFHDTDTLRMSGKKLIIKESKYSELTSLNVGLGGKGGGINFNEKIPLLSDIIKNTPKNKIVQIEIKEQVDDMRAIISELSNITGSINVQIISFDRDKLKIVRKHLPNLDCLLIIDKNSPKKSDNIKFAKDNGLKGIDLDYNLATEIYVKDAIKEGLEVGAWTVNDINIAKKLINNGVKYITGDFVDQFKVLKQENYKYR